MTQIYILAVITRLCRVAVHTNGRITVTILAVSTGGLDEVRISTLMNLLAFIFHEFINSCIPMTLVQPLFTSVGEQRQDLPWWRFLYSLPALKEHCTPHTWMERFQSVSDRSSWASSVPGEERKEEGSQLNHQRNHMIGQYNELDIWIASSYVYSAETLTFTDFNSAI